MTKNRALGLAASVSLILAIFVVLPGLGADEKDKDAKDTLYRPLGLFTEVFSLVRSNYVEPVEAKPLLVGAFSGMTEAMDPFSEYVPPDRMPAFNAARAAREKKEAIDVGIVLARRFNYPLIVAAIAGSPAAAAGLKSDDLVEKVDGQSMRGVALWEVEAKLAGKAGGRVRLSIVREGKPRRHTIDVVRGSWTPEAPSATRVEGELLVKIPSFAPGTVAALKAILTPLDRTKPLLIDLRSNAWGSFEEAAHAAALFTLPGPLAELKGRRIEGKTFTAEPGERMHDSRLVILVDSGTAGAAELFAAALRDAAAREAGVLVKVEQAKKKADGEEAELDSPEGEEAPKEAAKKPLSVRLVGEPTVGMGFTAQVVKLASGGSLKISVGKIRTASGQALSPKGILPDERVFALPPDEGRPQVDSILQRGLKVLSESRAKTAA